MWDDVEVEVVERLPNGIDGLRAYKINNVTDVKSRRAALSSDGRQWEKDTTTTWANKGPMRYADCRGSWRCNNENCIFKTQYGIVNRLQFQKKGVDRTCSACGNKAESVECLARRYLKIGKKSLQVFHIGQHTCPAKSETGKKQKAAIIRDMFTKDPNLKPSEVQSALIVSLLRGEEDWDKVDREASQLTDKKWIANQKQAVKKNINPQEENFEGLVTFKQYCDKKDNLYIFKVNDRRGNPDKPSHVFKTSKVKMQMAFEMDQDRQHYLNKEYCFCDGKRKRCGNFTTLTASVYHPLLRKQVPLAIMEAETEDSENIQIFWELFNQALQKLSKMPK